MRLIGLCFLLPAVVFANSTPWRADTVVGGALWGKVLLLTMLLLVAAYFALRWYAARLGQASRDSDRPVLRCQAALRLSSRTKVYLVAIGGAQVLIVESPAGSHSLRLDSTAVEPSGSEA